MLCFTRPRYQVSVYRTIGPLVLHSQHINAYLHYKSTSAGYMLAIILKTSSLIQRICQSISKVLQYKMSNIDNVLPLKYQRLVETNYILFKITAS